MMYSLTLAKDGRILSATYPKYNPDGVIVDKLPKGDITEYICKVDKEKKPDYEYILSPLPKPEPMPQEKTTDERLAELEQRQWETEAALIEIASMTEGGTA